MKVLAQLKLREKIVSENVFRITRAHKSSEQYILIITRMHSSRMRIARSLTRGYLPEGGVYMPRGYLPGGAPVGGVPA